MIRKYSFGSPFPTGAVLTKIAEESAPLPYFKQSSDGLSFFLHLNDTDIIYGLGESVRGMNKRGWKYISRCSDDPNHTETKHSLYGTHNFLLIIREEKSFGVFFDFPGIMTFDVGYTVYDKLEITLSEPDLSVYLVEEDRPLDIALSFRRLLGPSYLPPRWAFGYQQSRWGYRNARDVRRIVKEYREHEIPLDAVYLDIDYMDHYKDFTVDEEKFPDFPAFVEEMKQEHIHLVPIIDAGVKQENGYSVYDEGHEMGYFCKRADGSDFVAGVWPGKSCFPDFFQSEAAKWFGDKYQILLDAGIEGFWNDMNEPAIFYSEESLSKCKRELSRLLEKDLDVTSFFELTDAVNRLSNNPEDYRLFYHDTSTLSSTNVTSEMQSDVFSSINDASEMQSFYRHDRVHNLYGFYMTRAAAEAFDRLAPGRRILLFSRASYLGMHRYGGIWTGDNQSWWSHLLLNIKMMPSLNLCGFLYSGADLGGFGSDTTEDLMLRWLAFGIFTPLMRNHSAHDTREQEAFRFERTNSFRHLIQLRYRLIPYLYSEFMKCALSDGLLFRPLLFDYPEDFHAAQVEDQLMLGEGLMLTPVYEQNARGRYVYLPEDMLFIKFRNGQLQQQQLPKGHHYIDVEIDEVPVFLRPNCILPLGQPAQAEELIDYENLELIAFPVDTKHLTYEYYLDDGISRDATLAGHRKLISLNI